MFRCFSGGRECSICLNSIGLFEDFTTNCNHTYHHACIMAWLSRKSSCPDCRAPCCRYITMGLKVYKSTADLRRKLDEQLSQRFKGYESNMRRMYGIGTYTLDARSFMKKKNAKKEFEKILQDNIVHKTLLDNMASDGWCNLVKRLLNFGGSICYTAGFLDGLNNRLELLHVPEKQLMKELLKQSV